MLKCNQIKVQPGYTMEEVRTRVAKTLRMQADKIRDLSIIKESIDARKKPEIYYILTVVFSYDQEASLLKKQNRNKDLSLYKPVSYQFPYQVTDWKGERPVVVGSGPAGLFCAYMLAKHGFRPILIERGKPVSDRTRDVALFWEKGILNTESNVQFGEGGAGTFSDGKLNTLVHDKDGLNQKVLEIFVEHGANPRILYDAKPHIGTDVLTNVVSSMREQIKSWGGEVRFQTKLTGLRSEVIDGTRVLTGIEINGSEVIATNHCVLAIGHSARDTFEMLLHEEISMEEKSFAVGFRVMHPQSMINESQYAIADPRNLPPAPYKLTGKGEDGRGVYSFCMCPGGYVVNASSEEERTAVNGMSYSDRGGEYANSAIIVAVNPSDFPCVGPLGGIAFQRELEGKCYQAGQGAIPVERYVDFRAAVPTPSEVTFGKDIPLKGQFVTADLTQILPDTLRKSFIEGMDSFERKIKGFASEQAIVAGIESRTSSPVRIHRDDQLQSNVQGLFPCGEGAGYAGGITSAGMDGIRVARQVAELLLQK